jgi:PAS domain S-box-containing protein
MGSKGALGGSARSFLPSERAMSAALSATCAGVWEWDTHTGEQRWSEALWVLFGIPSDGAPPSHDLWLQSVHPDDREAASAAVRKAVHQRHPFEIAWRSDPAFGEPRWLMGRGLPETAASGETAGYIGIVMDITQRKLAEQQLQELNSALAQRVQERTQALNDQQRLLQTILDGVPGLVGYWDKSQRNRFANHAYQEWFGMSPQELEGRHISELLGPTLYDSNRVHLDAVLRGEQQCFNRDIPVPGEPGRVRISETHYLPDIADGEVRGFLVMVFDVTKVTLAERQARAANAAKSEFLANISHELRTPLNAMFGLAQIGAHDTEGTPSSRTFQQILASGQHLLSLINDVLDFSKIEAGKMMLQPQPMALDDVMEHVLAMTALRAEAKGLTLRLEESPEVPRKTVGDPTRLAQILVNLVANAIKFTDQGEVCLRFDFRHGELCVTVSDTGVGIEPGHLSQLFQPFVQGRDGIRRQGGTGLGLAICKRLALLMHGRIDVTSTPGEGSRFTVHLPLPESTPGDFRALSQVQLVGFPADSATAIQEALVARGCRCHAVPAVPPVRQPDHLLVIHESVLPHLDIGLLNRWIAQGSRIIVSMRVAPSTQLRLSGVALSDRATVVAGPLSPLRLLHALDAMDAQPLHRPAAHRHRLDALRILAAEDNPVNRLILAQMLENEGANVQFAADGAQAVALAQQVGTQAFDLVLCDIQMPVMDGLEATRQLLRLDPQLPIVGLTAHAFTQARQEAQAAGMCDYVTKPYLLDTLVDVIRKHARRQAPPLNTDHDPATAGPDAASASDWEAMCGHFQGQPALFDRLIDVALQSLPGVLAELDRCRTQADITGLAKIAHEIKGTALNLRANTLSSLSARTQDLARQHDPSCVTAARELSTSLNTFLEALRGHGASTAHATAAATTPAESVNEAVRTDVPQDGRGDFLNGLVRR